MSKALDLVNRFYQATGARKGVELTAALIADDIRFTGPVIQSSGADEYLTLLGQFLIK